MMKLERGCPYCKNLKSLDEQLENFECLKGHNIQNAGACFTEEIDGYMVFVENCPDFKEKGTVGRTQRRINRLKSK